MSKLNRMYELVDKINYYSNLYYNMNISEISDLEFDMLYDELLTLEKELNIIISSSPTQKVGYEVISKLEKVIHDEELLSLDKTKSIENLKRFIGNTECVLSLKNDGLTTKITYANGSLSLGATRGNSKIGEDITHSVKTFKNIPIKIDEDLTVVGESVIFRSDFEEINEGLSVEEKYKNSRNLVSGSVRQLNSKLCSDRNVRFLAFGLLKSSYSHATKSEQLEYLRSKGFEITPYKIVTVNNVEEAIKDLKELSEQNGIPIDGLVCSYNDIKFSNSLGRTSKFPKHSIALKSNDTEYETTFTGLELNTTRTGQVSLVGLFEPVDVDGVTVTKASLHNVDIFESLQLGLNDAILVRRANMVIPQIMDNLTRSNTMELPSKCPCCNSELEVRKLKDARFLYCPNDNCSAKLTQKIVHFASRDALNIVGLSEQTIQKFIDLNFVTRIIDLYYLDAYRDEIIALDGFGLKSYDKLIKAIESSTTTEFANFVYGLGIPSVGKSTAKTLSKYFNEETLPNVRLYDLLKLDDIGEVVANKIVDWFSNADNKMMYHMLVSEFEFKQPEQSSDNKLEGKVFVVTGSVNIYKNRKELSKHIEDLGGKVASSVSKGTDYLINNDAESSSSKNVSAKKLGVPIINEDQFIELIK